MCLLSIQGPKMKKEEKEVGPELLKKYIEEKCTPFECQLVERWLENGDQEMQSPEIFSNINSKLLQDRLWKAVVPKQSKRIKKEYVSPWMAAAIALLVSVISIWLYSAVDDSTQNNRYTVQMLRAEPGQKLIANLPDGSEIQLRAGTSIWYNVPFDERTVVLSGEGMFDIAHDAEHPFTVKTAKGRVQVLGTSFVVRSYPESTESMVSVRDGLVACRPREERISLKLHKGESIRFDRQTISDKTTISIEEIDLWSKNILSFDNTPFIQVTTELQRWFGVQIHHAPDLEKLEGTFRGKFVEPSIQNVLESLCFSLQLKYRIDKQEIYLYK